jgi:hypothetical protein
MLAEEESSYTNYPKMLLVRHHGISESGNEGRSFCRDETEHGESLVLKRPYKPRVRTGCITCKYVFSSVISLSDGMLMV